MVARATRLLIVLQTPTGPGSPVHAAKAITRATAELSQHMDDIRALPTNNRAAIGRPLSIVGSSIKVRHMGARCVRRSLLHRVAEMCQNKVVDPTVLAPALLLWLENVCGCNALLCDHVSTP
jgi:hypothetical protein